MFILFILYYEYVCMYECIYVCMYKCKYVCMYLYCIFVVVINKYCMVLLLIVYVLISYNSFLKMMCVIIVFKLKNLKRNYKIGIE